MLVLNKLYAALDAGRSAGVTAYMGFKIAPSPQAFVYQFDHDSKKAFFERF